MASYSCSYIASIHFFPFYLGHQVRQLSICTRPALAAKQNGDLFSLQPHPRYATLFSSGYENPGISPDLVAVERSDMDRLSRVCTPFFALLRPPRWPSG